MPNEISEAIKTVEDEVKTEAQEVEQKVKDTIEKVEDKVVPEVEADAKTDEKTVVTDAETLEKDVVTDAKDAGKNAEKAAPSIVADALKAITDPATAEVDVLAAVDTIVKDSDALAYAKQLAEQAEKDAKGIGEAVIGQVEAAENVVPSSTTESWANRLNTPVPQEVPVHHV